METGVGAGVGAGVVDIGHVAHVGHVVLVHNDSAYLEHMYFILRCIGH